jgi:uncharacterized protein YxeA
MEKFEKMFIIVGLCFLMVAWMVIIISIWNAENENENHENNNLKTKKNDVKNENPNQSNQN